MKILKYDANDVYITIEEYCKKGFNLYDSAQKANLTNWAAKHYLTQQQKDRLRIVYKEYRDKHPCSEKRELKAKIIEEFVCNPNSTLDDIAEKFNTHRHLVSKAISEYMPLGKSEQTVTITMQSKINDYIQR